VSILLVVVALVALVIAAPRIFQWPVKVTIDGQTFKVAYDSELEAVVRQSAGWEDYSGDMLAVDGSVWKEGAGGPPLIKSRGKELDPSTRIRSSITLNLSKGEDETEPVIAHEKYKKPSLDLKGNGPLRLVTNPGQMGITVTNVGELSGKKAGRQKAETPKEVKVRALSAANVKPKLVALTYDDGPNPGATEEILKILAAEKVKATFFVQGINVEKYPELAKKIVDEGHQIGNHSHRHAQYPKLSPPEMEEDIQQAQKVIKDATGVIPNWIRPPYGLVDSSVYSVIGKKDLKIAHWNVDPADWRKPGSSPIILRVIQNVGPGSIVLLHDGGGDRSQTVAATRPIVRWLKEQGYKLVTVEQLYQGML